MTLSPSQQAILYGAGSATLVRGGSTWSLSDREMQRLVAEWATWERERRPGIDPLVSLGLVGAAVPSEPGGESPESP